MRYSIKLDTGCGGTERCISQIRCCGMCKLIVEIRTIGFLLGRGRWTLVSCIGIVFYRHIDYSRG